MIPLPYIRLDRQDDSTRVGQTTSKRTKLQFNTISCLYGCITAHHEILIPATDQPGPVADFEQFTVGNPFPVNINAVLMRSELARFREDCGVVTDLDMMIRFGIAGRKAVLLEEELIHYRVHAGATSANRLKMFSESLAVYRDYLGQTTKPALYRMRLFRTLAWCVIYLTDQGERASARRIVGEYGRLVGLPQRLLLKLALLMPWRLSFMEKIRALRGKWIGAN